MTADDERELAEWRFVFGHLGDGTPDGAGNAINARMAELEQERDDWKQVAKYSAELGDFIASLVTL